MSINVVIADDHAIVREGIKIILQSAGKDIRVVAEAENGRDILDLIEKNSIDIFILDIAMPLLNGIETTRRLIKKDPESRIIILSMYDDRASVEKALKAGAKGYLIKESAIEEVVQAVQDVCLGRSFLSSKLSQHVLEKFSGSQKDYAKETDFVELTDKEREILQMLAEGLSSKEIAAQLKMSFHTVNVHRNNIMQKLGSHKLAELVRYAIKEGITHI